MAVLTNDENEPYVHIAALMVTSITLQRMLKESGVPEEMMQYIRERALELADGIQINISLKGTPR